MAHAFLAPSAAHRWLHCTAAPALEATLPQETSFYAEEGTKAHAIAAAILSNEPYSDEDATSLGEDNMKHIRSYVDFVTAETTDGYRNIEMPLAIADITGEIGAKGTADCASLVGTTLKVIDLKFGMGVKVFAANNPQLQIYALGALAIFEMVGDVDKVELIIYQPRIDGGHIDRWTISVEDLKRFGETVRVQAQACLDLKGIKDLPLDAFAPCEEACKFCRGKAWCPGLAQQVETTALVNRQDGVKPVDFLDINALAYSLDHIDMIEAWCKAVRERATHELENGNAIPGYKLVAGRKGARKWVDDKEVEKALKAMRIKADDMYTKKVITPTQAEKLHKSGTIGDRQWPKLQELITQSEGTPTIVKDSDPRPAYQLLTFNDFEKLEN